MKVSGFREIRGLRVSGFREVRGLRVSGFRVEGFWVLEFRVPRVRAYQLGFLGLWGRRKTTDMILNCLVLSRESGYGLWRPLLGITPGRL